MSLSLSPNSVSEHGRTLQQSQPEACSIIWSEFFIRAPLSLLAYLLFGDEEYLFIFQKAYGAAMHYLYNDPWYVEVNMDSAAIVWPLFNSLLAFWPGLQVLAGDIDPAIQTHASFFSVWKRYGFTPEGFSLATLSVQVKYLWLLFDLAAGPDKLVENGPYKYIFSTEGHLLPATAQISLVREHCSYFGAYCKNGYHRQESHASDISTPSQEINGSRLYNGQSRTSFPSDSFYESTSVSGLIKGVCPSLTHGQKFGISYVASTDTSHNDESTNERQTPVVESSSVVIVSNSNVESFPSDGKNDHDDVQESSEGGLEKEPPQK